MKTLSLAATTLVAALTVVTLSACSTPENDPSASTPAPSASAVIESLPTSPIAIDEYVDRFSLSGEWLSVEQVDAEYVSAASVFPLPLPDRYGFPPTTGFEAVANESYEAGNGVGQVYFFWLGATATAAHAAHVRGDDVTADALLDRMADADAGPLRSMYFDPERPGPNGPYFTAVIEPAQEGNWEPMLEQEVQLFTDRWPEIVEAAGGSL